MAENYTELKEYDDEEIMEVEEKKESKIKGFIKKHYKKALVGAGLVAATFAGYCLGSRKADDDDIYDLDELVPDSVETEGPQATE